MTFLQVLAAFAVVAFAASTAPKIHKRVIHAGRRPR